GHMIGGLTSEGYGLFSTLKSGAKIKNVVLDNVYITSKYSSAGAIAASIPSSAQNVVIENCYVNGVVASCRTKFGLNAGSSTAGSIVGRNDSATAVISGCYSNAVVAAERTVGGIAGINYGTIKSCGFGGQTGSSYNIYELGCDMNGVKREDYKYLYCVGGICGFNYNKVSNSFSNCTRVDVASYYGGIVGVLQKSGSVSYCVNSSEVLYDDNLTGGLIAGYASGKSKLSNCYTKSPTNNTVQNDVGKGGTGKQTYRISDRNYNKISSFKTLDGDWQIWDGVPILKKLKSYVLMAAPEYEIKGEKLIPIEYSVDAVAEEEDLSVDYGYDEFGDILE
ncbi:MAG: hypothetical protein K2K44_02165, partial [Oscillospiraceae bacterium]|nr:hypothetical protein [Oscillospiraceae bacterium]